MIRASFVMGEDAVIAPLRPCAMGKIFVDRRRRTLAGTRGSCGRLIHGESQAHAVSKVSSTILQRFQGSFLRSIGKSVLCSGDLAGFVDSQSYGRGFLKE